MPLIICPECSERISDKARVCPSCGAPSVAATLNREKVIWGGFAVFVIVVTIAILALTA